MEKLRHLAHYHARKQKQFILYAAIGVSGVVLDYILFAIGTQWLGLGVLLANFISISAGIANNFWLNRKYNFKTHDHTLKRFALFYAVGALGIILSEALILLFHYGFDMNDLLAKLLTLPFVLVFQFFLNKRYSFGDLPKVEKQIKRLVFHWPFLIVLVVYAFCSAILVSAIPNNFYASNDLNGPDEDIHYKFNVQYILEHAALPVSGRDDLEALGACRDNPHGIVPCVYSYNAYPAPNYILSAISAGIFSKAMHIKPETAARFVSFASGVLFVIFAYATAYAIGKRRLFATLLVAAAAFIPQVIFTNSYTNMDAYSLAISGFLGFTLVKFMQQPRKRLWQILYAVALFGLLPVSKYNYVGLGIAGVIMAIYVFVRNRFSRKEILLFGAYALGSFLLIAAFWYIRNLVLYHDLTGQNFVLQEMLKHHPAGRYYDFGWEGLFFLFDANFFDILFRSFFTAFGMMNYFLDQSAYNAELVLLLVVGGLFAYNLFQPTITKRENRKIWWALAICLFTVFVTLLFIIYNSLYFDFQPQGRYMYPILMPIIMLLSYVITKDKRYRLLPFLLAAGTAFIFSQGLMLFMKVYF